MLKSVISKRSQQFIKRWPKNPKIVFFTAPNCFQNELIHRFSIDMGVPVISVTNVFNNIS